ncbi:MAG: hypothetical protein MI865_01285 [Proteobacteria bacterium]|nr:hypothetical protein [Pseudomonadota bacterium]
MKTRILLAAITLGFSTVLLAQKPKDGATISLNTYDFELSAGQSVDIPVQLVRSDRFKKGVIEGLTIQQKDGLTASFERAEGEQDLYVLTIEAESIKEGTYPLVIKAEGKSARKVKQSMIMLKVVEGSQLASSN